MESKKQIEPHKITKPIQLLAAWLSGLVVVNGSFLAAATQIKEPVWVAGTLIIASIVNVPLFLIAIFLLQTKFRPEMQEDSYYARYLESKTGHTEREVTAESFASIREDIGKLEVIVSEKVLQGTQQFNTDKIKWSSVTVMLNKVLDNFADIAKSLSKNGIPVHETFGGGADKPKIFKIAVGNGFSVDQIRSLILTTGEVIDGWVSFAHDDDELNQYDNQVLIGAYGEYKHGIKISQIKPIIEREGVTEAEIYKVIGR